VGAAASCKSAKDVEALTAEMSVPLRRKLRIRRRLPDTTLRDVLTKLSPNELRFAMHRLIKAAHRRGSLKPTQLPFGVVAMDGKTVVIDAWDEEYAQRHRFDDKQQAVGLARTVTSALVSADA